MCVSEILGARVASRLWIERSPALAVWGLSRGPRQISPRSGSFVRGRDSESHLEFIPFVGCKRRPVRISHDLAPFPTSINTPLNLRIEIAVSTVSSLASMGKSDDWPTPTLFPEWLCPWFFPLDLRIAQERLCESCDWCHHNPLLQRRNPRPFHIATTPIDIPRNATRGFP